MARPRLPRAWSLLEGRDGRRLNQRWQKPSPWMYGYVGLDEPLAPGYLFPKKTQVWMSRGIWSLRRLSLRRCYFDPAPLTWFVCKGAERCTSVCQRKVNIRSHTPITIWNALSLLQVHDPMMFCWVLLGYVTLHLLFWWHKEIDEPSNKIAIRKMTDPFHPFSVSMIDGKETVFFQLFLL